MAIGRTFREALGKAIRSLETGRAGFDLPMADDLPAASPADAGRAAAPKAMLSEIERAIATPTPDRICTRSRTRLPARASRSNAHTS